MKKILILSIAGLFLIFGTTGCGTSKNDNTKNNKTNTTKTKYDEIVCTNTSDSIASSIVADIQYQNNYIKNIKYTYTFTNDSKAIASTVIKEFENDFKNITGVKSNYSNKIWTITYDFEKINLNNYKNANDKYTKFISSEIKKDYSYIDNNNVLLDIYKSTELENYTCK